jgi:hypothetical protein
MYRRPRPCYSQMRSHPVPPDWTYPFVLNFSLESELLPCKLEGPDAGRSKSSTPAPLHGRLMAADAKPVILLLCQDAPTSGSSCGQTSGSGRLGVAESYIWDMIHSFSSAPIFATFSISFLHSILDIPFWTFRLIFLLGFSGTISKQQHVSPLPLLCYVISLILHHVDKSPSH